MIICLWIFLGIIIFCQVYSHYDQYVSHLPGGKPVVGVACLGQSTLVRRGKTRVDHVVYSANRKSSPSIQELTEIATEIAGVLEFKNKVGKEVEEFADSLRASKFKNSHERIKVPESIARGHELYVSEVTLHGAHLHPTFPLHRVVVLAKTGRKRGKAFLMPWNHRESQKLFSGSLSPSTFG